MKKNNYVILVLLLSVPLPSWAQLWSTAQDVLSANQALATFTNNGALFYREDGNGFQVPYFPGSPQTSTIYAAGLWLAAPGENGAEDASSSVSIYRSVNNKVDFGVGPLNSDGQILDDPLFTYFDQIWKVDREEVLNFLEDFADNQVLDDAIPLSIRQWPARGNPWVLQFYGEPLPDQDLAPFYDQNGDGLYDPQEGDYPVLDPENPQVIPDQLMWYVFNDVYLHTQSISDSMIVEIQVTAYSFLCEDNALMNTTVFTRHKIINKSGGTLEGFKAGFWYDADLGCRNDDFMGCDTTLNTIYFYNSDAIDGDEDCECFDGTEVYCGDPPVQAMTLLNQEMATAVYTLDGLFPLDPSSVIDPTAESYYNFLTGNWFDGTPMTYGGTGFDTTTTISTTYAFPDAPLNADGWSMYTAGIEGEDVRGLFSLPAIDLADQTSITIDVAYSYHRQPGQDHLQNVDVMLEEVPLIKSYYDNDFSDFCTQGFYCVEDCVRPGDANNDQVVNGEDYLSLGLAMGNDASGPARSIVSTNWFPFAAEDWALTFADGTNAKHADCNGDGVVTLQDEQVTTTNYTLSTNDYVPEPDVESPADPAGLLLSQLRDTVSANAPGLQRMVRTTVSLGTEENPIENIYGLSFTIVYDTSLLTTTMWFDMVQMNNEFFTDGEVLENFYIHPESNRVDFSFCATDGENVSSFGQLAYFSFVLRDDVETANPDGTSLIDFKVVNLKAIDAEGNTLQGINTQVEPVVVTNLTVDNNDLDIVDQKVNIFPNPNNGKLYFDLSSTKLTFPLEIKLYDFTGRQVAATRLAERQAQWSWSLPSTVVNGTYIVQINATDRQIASERIVIER